MKMKGPSTPDAGYPHLNPESPRNIGGAGRRHGSLISYDATLSTAAYPQSSPPNTPRSQTPINTRPNSPTAHGISESETIKLLFDIVRTLGASETVVSGHALFWEAPIEPWVTRARLRKLDILSIVNDPSLRWDICYTTHLAYRRADGPESEMKIEERNNYRKAIRIELELYSLLPKILDFTDTGTELDAEKVRSTVTRRVPQLLKTIKQILQTILPKNEHVYLERLFEIPFMMNEILSGCFNFESVATCLSELLIRHAAPIRDNKIRGFVQTISKGDIDSITEGLSEILSTLELMKIDTSNYVLRHFKPNFIDLTITFGLRYFGNRILRGKFSALPARNWFLNNRHPRTPEVIQARTRNIELSYFVEAFVRHLSPRCTTLLPETFAMDTDRIEALRKAIKELVQLRICRLILKLNLERLKAVLPKTAEMDFFRRIWLTIKTTGGMAESVSEIAPQMVKTITRYSRHTKCGLDPDLIEEIQGHLKADLAPISHRFYSEEMEISSFLAVNAFNTANGLLNSNPWDIYTRLVPAVSKSSSFSVSGLSLDAWRNEDQALRSMSDLIAHVLLLNWRVFGEMIYLNHELDATTACRGVQQHSTPEERPTKRGIAVRPQVPG
jgi:hypothetical protein